MLGRCQQPTTRFSRAQGHVSAPLDPLPGTREVPQPLRGGKGSRPRAEQRTWLSPPSPAPEGIPLASDPTRGDPRAVTPAPRELECISRTTGRLVRAPRRRFRPREDLPRTPRAHSQGSGSLGRSPGLQRRFPSPATRPNSPSASTFRSTWMKGEWLSRPTVSTIGHPSRARLSLQRPRACTVLALRTTGPRQRRPARAHEDTRGSATRHGDPRVRRPRSGRSPTPDTLNPRVKGRRTKRSRQRFLARISTKAPTPHKNFGASRHESTTTLGRGRRESGWGGTGRPDPAPAAATYPLAKVGRAAGFATLARRKTHRLLSSQPEKLANSCAATFESQYA